MAAAAVVVLAGCNRGVSLDLRLPEGATAEVAFSVGHQSRVQVDDFAPEFALTGTRTVEVRSGGVLGDDTLVLVDRVGEASMYRKLGDGPATWSVEDGAPEVPFAEAARWYQWEHTVTIAPDRSVAVEPAVPDEALPGDFEADLPALFASVLNAPDRRFKTGDSWWIENGTTEDGEPIYRTWTLSGVDGDGIALIEESNVTGKPVDGALPGENRQRRTRLRIDVRSGLPVDYRMRDLRRTLLAVDVEATFTWPG